MSDPNKITIKRAENGFIVKGYDPFSESSTRSVYQEFDNPMVTLQELLFHVSEFAGYSYDGYGKNNLKIIIDEVGDEVEIQYETVELELDDETFGRLSVMAHENDLTLNQMVVKILEQGIERESLDDEG